MSDPLPFDPRNPLEVALVDAKQRKIPFEQFIRTLLGSEVAVLSGTEVREDGSGLTPVVFDKQPAKMVAIFSSLERARHFQSRAQFVLTIKTSALLGGLSRDLGIVLNPGFVDGVEISPEGIARILRDFGMTAT